jgi:hypothetical protein
MNSSSPRLESAIRTQLRPRLQEDGFVGSGRIYRKVSHGVIQVLHIQGSRQGGRFAVNLGFQPIVIPDVLGRSPDLTKITDAECEFRRRLSENGTDQWWNHDSSEKGMDDAVAAATDVYVRFGRPLFEIFGGPRSPLFSIAPEQMPQFREIMRGFGSTEVRVALVLARLRTAEGRPAEAKAFAHYGLLHVGRAAALQAELERLSRTQ